MRILLVWQEVQLANPQKFVLPAQKNQKMWQLHSQRRLEQRRASYQLLAFLLLARRRLKVLEPSLHSSSLIRFYECVAFRRGEQILLLFSTR